jgi:hypothetical protein
MEEDMIRQNSIAFRNNEDTGKSTAEGPLAK